MGDHACDYGEEADGAVATGALCNLPVSELLALSRGNLAELLVQRAPGGELALNSHRRDVLTPEGERLQ